VLAKGHLKLDPSDIVALISEVHPQAGSLEIAESVSKIFSGAAASTFRDLSRVLNN
jgi:hypothetical protein